MTTMELPVEIDLERPEWDSCNRAHIARHAVTPQEVHEVCFGDPVVREGSKGRVVAVGPTRAGRMPAAAPGPKPGEIVASDTFTARLACRRERRRYQEVAGGKQR